MQLGNAVCEHVAFIEIYNKRIKLKTIATKMCNVRKIFYNINISLKPSLEAHVLKCFTTERFRKKLLLHKMQPKFLISECTSWWDSNADDVKKRFTHSQQTYGFTPLCWRICSLRSPLLTNFFWQMLQTSQVPSLCDTSRCRFSSVSYTHLTLPTILRV